ncbi:MAG TPA: hypothetical protein QGG93_02820 [Verrucomicrobiota bacterium]|nr:hypothetical protein [Verrucomicrobiota bacterium]
MRLTRRYSAEVLKWVTAVAVLGLVGCSLLGKWGGAVRPMAKPGGGTMVDPVAFRVEGKVVRTNVRLNFVVLDFGLQGLPAIGQQFTIYRLGKRVGQVRVSGPAWDTYAVADIVEGEIWTGDEAKPK